MQRINILRAVFLLLIWTLAGGGCTGSFMSGPHSSNPVEGKQFVMVYATAQDTLNSLAATYLHDPASAWRIAAYNGIDTLTPGQRVIIPLIPLHQGGLQLSGYQMVPILLYTRLTKTSRKSGSISAEAFNQQMRHLGRTGFQTISLDQLDDFLNLRGQIPANATVITFDSAGRWVYEIAYPILRRYGMTAALFVPTDDIGRPGNLSWQQLAEMSAAGFDVGAYGRSAHSLTSFKAGEDVSAYLNRLEDEISEPQKQIQVHLKKPCRYFAYPHGQSNDLIIALLRKHGYRLAFSRKRGSNPFFVDDFKVRRSLIKPNFDIRQFRQNLDSFHRMELR